MIPTLGEYTFVLTKFPKIVSHYTSIPIFLNLCSTRVSVLESLEEVEGCRTGVPLITTFFSIINKVGKHGTGKWSVDNEKNTVRGSRKITSEGLHEVYIVWES